VSYPPALPAGVVKYREKWVKSVPISFPELTAQCIIKGRFDAILTFEDGSYGIIDYKASHVSEEKAAFFSRLLSAYAYAQENPAPGALPLSPITRRGLFIITPHRFERMPNGEIAFVSRTTWMDIPRNDAAFLALLGKVVKLLELPIPPDPAVGCGLCNYRKDYRDAGILE
jgi:hypothetical protein